MVKVLQHPRAGQVVLHPLPKGDPHAPKLFLRDYRVTAKLPAPPSSVDYTEKAKSVIVLILKNDQLGCCVISEDGHYIGALTFNANTGFTYSDDQIVADYSAIAGYVPGNANTDQGTDPIAALNYRVKVGYADGSKDIGYLMVDATNPEEVRTALDLFGNLKLWLALPDSYVNPFPSGHGFVWDVGTPDPQNGHCIGGYGYDVTSLPAFNVTGVTAQGVVIDSWGDVGILTWAALAALCVPAAGGGCATRINLDWLSKATQKAPNGIDWDSLLSDFDTMGGTVPVPPSPAPTPPPTPPAPPTAAPTLAEAQAAVNAAFDGDFPLIPRSTAKSQADAALAAVFPPSGS